MVSLLITRTNCAWSKKDDDNYEAESALGRIDSVLVDGPAKYSDIGNDDERVSELGTFGILLHRKEE